MTQTQQESAGGELSTEGLVVLDDAPGAHAVPLTAGGPEAPRPWGPWATLGLLLASLVISFVIAMIAAIGWGVVVGITGGRFNPQATGFLLLITAVFLVGLLVAVVGFSLIRGVPLRDYFALRRASWREVAIALGATLALIVAEFLVNLVVSREVAQFMLDLVAEPTALPGVLVLVLVVAPVAEELIFRGFVWKGLVDTVLGPIGAAVIASFLWMLLHLGQYGPIDLGLIFIFGLLLGWARHRSGSIYVPMAMHLMLNLLAMVALLAFYA